MFKCSLLSLPNRLWYEIFKRVYLHSFFHSFLLFVLSFLAFFSRSGSSHSSTRFFRSWRTTKNIKHSSYDMYTYAIGMGDCEYENGRNFSKWYLSKFGKNDFGFSWLSFSDWNGVALTSLNILISKHLKESHSLARIYSILPVYNVYIHSTQWSKVKSESMCWHRWECGMCLQWQVFSMGQPLTCLFKLT